MRSKITLVLSLILLYSYSFAQDITPTQIERSQELLRQEETLRQRIEQPQNKLIKEIILPQGCLITANKIQELLEILAQAYQETYPRAKSQKATFTIDNERLKVTFE